MGKIEDMRRVREQQFADNEARRARASKALPATEVVPPPAPVAQAKEKAAPIASPSARHAERGACATCGKTKPLENGLIASHQKGFGKACPGSRKPPA